MLCMHCARTNRSGGDLYCCGICAAQARGPRHSTRRSRENIAVRCGRCSSDRPVSREEAAGFFGWITREAA